MELTANVHREDGSYWAEVAELPGCFGAGETLDELFESLDEGIRLYLSEGSGPEGGGPTASMRVRSAVLTDSPA